jgi:phytoene/squalene synthetase
MTRTLFVKVDDVAKELGISKAHAYKLIRSMNMELQKQGYITIAGRVSRKYFEERVYGSDLAQEVK